MLVGRRMTREVVTVRPEDKLLAAEEAMKKGGFRSVPVVTNGKLVGIITDRDLRRHEGFFEQTRVDATMTENPLTVTPQTTLEQAALLLLRHKIGSLPVIEEGKLVGIITTSDMLRAFLEVIGASEEGRARGSPAGGGRTRSCRGIESHRRRGRRGPGRWHLSGEMGRKSRLLPAFPRR